MAVLWYYAAPVNFIFTVEPSDGETPFTHKIDGLQREGKTHVAIKRYNHIMQAVDQSYQLQVAFYLAT
jgi:hypothetical protein